MNALITNLDDRMADRNHTKPFRLLPTVCLSSVQVRKLSCMSFATDLPSGKTPILLRSKMKRWISYYQRFKKKKKKSKKTTKKKRELMEVLPLN